jgi:hypothetical protein
MKKYLSFITICFKISSFAVCQNIGIGTAVPNSSAQLDITSTSKGILIPRMNTAVILSISSPAKGLMVYDSLTNQLMVNMGTSAIPSWQTVVFNSGWSLNGNANINPATQFIGTTDNQPLLFRINNTPAGELTPNGNVFLGLYAGRTSSSSNDNIAIGNRAFYSNTTGYFNTAIGSSALYFNSTGYSNTAYGYYALFSNNTGYNNTANGIETLHHNVGGFENTANGAWSLYSNTFGCYNTAIGGEALYSNTSASFNTANGNRGLYSNTTGQFNCANGVDALYHNTTGSLNTAHGIESLYSNGAGGYNTAFGEKSLHENNGSTGNYNTAVGGEALYSTTNSQYNTAIGYTAGGAFDLGYNNTFLGANCDANAPGLYNCIAIGQGVTCTASSQARIGNTATNSIGGQVGWTTLSDGRYKKNVQENVKGIDFIMRLHPVTYQLDVQGISNKLNESRGREIDPQTKLSIAEKEKMIFSGFIAQDVQTAAKEAGYDFSGVDAPKNENDFYGLRYGDFVVPLVKAAQEQQVILNDLQKKVQTLEDQIKLLLQTSTHKN